MSNLIEHAKKELKLIGYKFDETEDPYNKMFLDSIFELLETFSKQGHSGFSAPYTIETFKKLAMFETLTPLTGNDEEWGMGDEDSLQNTRMTSVFKDKESGKSFFIYSIIFKDESNSTFTGSVLLEDGTKLRSSNYIKSFPYTEKKFYIDVYEKNDEYYVKNEKDLEEVWKHYDRRY